MGWYSSVRDTGIADSEDGRKYLYSKFSEFTEIESNRMANERAVNYHRFMTHAISHKNGQVYDRILKKKPETTARPVSREKMVTTENQHHADEQISVWAKVWKAEVQNEHVILGAQVHVNRTKAQSSSSGHKPSSYEH